MGDYEDAFDADDLEEIMAENQNPDDLTPEEVFSMVMLNKLKGTKVTVELEDKDGDKIELSDIIEGLIGYVKDKLKDQDGSDFTEQIMPLMSQSVVSGLGRMIGIGPTAFYLSQEGTRHSIIYMMCVGFLLLKYVQEHELLIHTYEEEVSPDEIEEIERKSKASSVATMGTMMGMNPQEILQQMVDKGQITEEDFQDLFPHGTEEEEEEENDTNDPAPEDDEE